MTEKWGPKLYRSAAVRVQSAELIMRLHDLGIVLFESGLQLNKVVVRVVEVSRKCPSFDSVLFKLEVVCGVNRFAVNDV